MSSSLPLRDLRSRSHGSIPHETRHVEKCLMCVIERANDNGGNDEQGS